MKNRLILLGLVLMTMVGSVQGQGIFGRLPKMYQTYYADMVKASHDYVDSRVALSKNSGGTYWKAFEAKEKELVNVYKGTARKLGLTDSDPTQKGSKIPFTTDGSLPYTVESVKKVDVTIPPYVFPEMTEDKNKPTANLFPKAYPFIKQSPLVLCVVAEVNLKLKKGFTGSTVPLYCYVPGNGPDGKRMGWVYLFPVELDLISAGKSLLSVKGKKGGDTVSTLVLIYGWGTPGYLDNMKSLVFTDKDDDAQRRSARFSVGGARALQKNPLIDWMDAWYKKQTK